MKRIGGLDETGWARLNKVAKAEKLRTLALFTFDLAETLSYFAYRSIDMSEIAYV